MDQPVNSDEKVQLDEQLRSFDHEGNEMLAEYNTAKAEVKTITEDTKVVRDQRVR